MKLKIETTTLYRAMNKNSAYIGPLFKTMQDAKDSYENYPYEYTISEVRGVYVNDSLYVDAEVMG